MKEFLEAHVEGSRIKEITYNNQTTKWTITYDYDVDPDVFDSFEDMKFWFDHKED